MLKLTVEHYWRICSDVYFNK